jgi:hypothetical protein
VETLPEAAAERAVVGVAARFVQNRTLTAFQRVLTFRSRFEKRVIKRICLSLTVPDQTLS